MRDEELRDPSTATGTAALVAGWSHGHRDVSGGWLRPTVFGAVDGLVTNASLIAGLGGGRVSADTIVLTGVAALVAGAFSMGTGEYISTLKLLRNFRYRCFSWELAQVQVFIPNYISLPRAQSLKSNH